MTPFTILVSIFTINMCLHSVLNVELTVTVEPGKVDCFYEKFSADQLIGVDYQVISGGQGKLDVTFHILSPSGAKLAEDVREADNAHSITAPETGIYAFCWDNSFSHFSYKTIYFEISVINPLNDFDEWKKNSNSPYSDEDLASDVQQGIEHILERLSMKLNSIRTHQANHLHLEARDRMLAEKNFEYVNWWAIIQITVMIIVGVIQVVLIRSLFELDPRSNRSWPWGPRR